MGDNDNGGDPTGIATPTSSDDVFFTSTNVNNCTIGAAADCLSLDFTGGTGYSGTLAGSSALSVYGSLTLDSAMTRTYTGDITFKATATGETVTTAGLALVNNMYFSGAGGGWTLQDDLNLGITKSVFIVYGSLQTNGKTVTVRQISTNNTNTRTLDLTDSIVNVGNGVQFDSTNLTLTVSGSVMKFTSSAFLYVVNGITLNNVEFNGTTHTIYGSNTFNDIKIAAGTEVKLVASTTQTVTTFTATGSDGNLITLLSTTTTNATLAKAGGGVISCDWMDVDYITGSPDTTWYMGANSTDGTHNVQIYFTVPPTGGAIKSYNGVLWANIKSINGVAIADIKAVNGVAV